MLGELIGEFKGKVTGVRILPEGKTEMSIHGSGKIIGVDATYASTGAFTHLDNNVLMEVGNGLITTIDHDFATVNIMRISVSTGKGKVGSFRDVSHYLTKSEKLSRLNKVIGVSEFETDEKWGWILKIWEWK